MPIPRERLETEDVNKLLFSLSLPAFIAMLANGLYNIIDTMLIGRGVGTLAIGAIAIGFPIQSLYMAFSQMVAIGSAQAISRSLGENDEEKASQIATNSYVLSVILSIILSILSLVFLQPLLILFGATKDLLPYATQYIQIIALGITFNSVSLLSNAVLRSQGFIKLSTFSVLVGIITSLCLSPLLVLGFGFGIRGAAIGTVSSQLTSCLFGLFFIIISKTGVPLKVTYLRLRFDIVKQILAVGLSAFARNSSTSISSLIINNTLRIYGGSFTILTFGVVNRIVSFFFLPVLGITQGLQPVASYNYGAKHYGRILKVVKCACIYATILCLLGTVICLLFPYQIIALFTKDEAVIKAGITILRLKIVLFSLVGIQMVSATLFQSLGKAWPSLFLSLLRQFIILLPLVYFLPKINNLETFGVWLSFPLTDIISFLITIVLLIHQLKQLKAQIKEAEITTKV